MIHSVEGRDWRKNRYPNPPPERPPPPRLWVNRDHYCSSFGLVRAPDTRCLWWEDCSAYLLLAETMSCSADRKTSVTHNSIVNYPMAILRPELSLRLWDVAMKSGGQRGRDFNQITAQPWKMHLFLRKKKINDISHELRNGRGLVKVWPWALHARGNPEDDAVVEMESLVRQIE